MFLTSATASQIFAKRGSWPERGPRACSAAGRAGGAGGVLDRRFPLPKVPPVPDLEIHGFLIRIRLNLRPLRIWFGFAKGDIPYHALWNGQGTGKPVPRMIPTFMQTMGLYEFLNDRFAFVFLSHNFRKLLYKSPYKWLQPEPVFHQNFAWGNLRNPTEHQGITTNTLNKGYWESGFMLNNLIKFKYMKSLKIGLGGGVFFRYGYYHRDKFSENVAYKFSFSIGV